MPDFFDSQRIWPWSGSSLNTCDLTFLADTLSIWVPCWTGAGTSKSCAWASDSMRCNGVCARWCAAESLAAVPKRGLVPEDSDSARACRFAWRCGVPGIRAAALSTYFLKLALKLLSLFLRSALGRCCCAVLGKMSSWSSCSSSMVGSGSVSRFWALRSSPPLDDVCCLGRLLARCTDAMATREGRGRTRTRAQRPRPGQWPPQPGVYNNNVNAGARSLDGSGAYSLAAAAFPGLSRRLKRHAR